MLVSGVRCRCQMLVSVSGVMTGVMSGVMSGVGLGFRCWYQSGAVKKDLGF